MRPFAPPWGRRKRVASVYSSSGTPMTTRTAAEPSPAGSCTSGIRARSSTRARAREGASRGVLIGVAQEKLVARKGFRHGGSAAHSAVLSSRPDQQTVKFSTAMRTRTVVHQR